MRKQLERLNNQKIQEVQHRHLVNNMFNPTDPNMRSNDLMATANFKFIFTLNEIFMYYGYESILPPDLMQYRQLVLGVKSDTQSSRSISATSPHATDVYEDDDDLFG